MNRAILIGDSIRMGYQPLVADRLAGRFELTGPQQNGGDSRRVLAELAHWLGDSHPDIVHVKADPMCIPVK